MKKHFQTIAMALIPAVSFASILCCNFLGVKIAEASYSGSVSASESIPADLPPCHRQAKTEVPAKKDCGCCIQKKLRADLPAKISLQAPQEIIGSVSFYILPQQFVFLKDQLSLAYLNGPPGPVSDQALHITFHNFRI